LVIPDSGSSFPESGKNILNKIFALIHIFDIPVSNQTSYFIIFPEKKAKMFFIHMEIV
jgi:hypothetical protein